MKEVFNLMDKSVFSFLLILLYKALRPINRQNSLLSSKRFRFSIVNEKEVLKKMLTRLQYICEPRLESSVIGTLRCV